MCWALIPDAETHPPSLEVNDNQKEHSSPRPCAPQTCPFPQNLTPALHVNDFALYVAAS